MASSYSSNLKIELITTGSQAGTWGDTTNSNFTNVFEQSIVGRANPVFLTDADLTLTYTDSVSSQIVRNVYLNVTSSTSLTATWSLIVPTIYKNYIVENNTTGGQSITIKTSAGTGITIPNGSKAPVYVDAVNVNAAFNYLSGDVKVSGAFTSGTLSTTTIGGTLITAQSASFSGSGYTYSFTTAKDVTINSMTVGKGGASVISNTAVGVDALLNSNGTSASNVAVGTSALKSNTSGVQNSAFGASALLNNSDGYRNSAFGYQS